MKLILWIVKRTSNRFFEKTAKKCKYWISNYMTSILIHLIYLTIFLFVKSDCSSTNSQFQCSCSSFFKALTVFIFSVVPDAVPDFSSWWWHRWLCLRNAGLSWASCPCAPAASGRSCSPRSSRPRPTKPWCRDAVDRSTRKSPGGKNNKFEDEKNLQCKNTLMFSTSKFNWIHVIYLKPKANYNLKWVQPDCWSTRCEPIWFPPVRIPLAAVSAPARWKAAVIARYSSWCKTGKQKNFNFSSSEKEWNCEKRRT